MFFKKEVYVSTKMEDYVKAKQALQNVGISYDIKIRNTGSTSSRASQTMGRFGEQPHLETFYYIYVSPKDEEAAAYVLNKIRR